jgi:plastocyanin
MFFTPGVQAGEGDAMTARSVKSLILVLAMLLLGQSANATIHTITMSGTSFSPKGTILHWGDTVRWNNSAGLHTSTSDVTSDKAWNSGTVSAGAHFDLVIVQADGSGPFAYHCTFHVGLGMKDTLHIAPPPCCSGQRGNVNCTGVIDLADLSKLISFLTQSGTTICCTAAADVNGSGTVDLVDLSALVAFLLTGTFTPSNCP